MSLLNELWRIVGSYLHDWEIRFMNGDQNTFGHVCAAGYTAQIADFKSPNWNLGFCAAAENGHLDLMKYLLTLHPIKPSCAMHNAAIGGYIDCIEFVSRPDNHNTIMETAVKHNHKHVIKKYKKTGQSYSRCAQIAIEHNRIGMLQLLCPDLSTMSFMIAVDSDKIIMIKYIHQTFGYNSHDCEQAMHLARSLPVLLYLYANANYNETDNHSIFLTACKSDNKILMTFLSFMDVQPYDRALSNQCSISTIKFLADYTKINPNSLLANTQSLQVIQYAIDLGATNQVEMFYEACMYSNLEKMKLLYTPSVDISTAYAQFDTGLNLSDTTYLEYCAIHTFLQSHGYTGTRIGDANLYRQTYDIQPKIHIGNLSSIANAMF